MEKSQAKFIKINPRYNSKNPAIEVLVCGQFQSEVSNLEVEPICINCQKWLRKQIKIVNERGYYCIGCFAAVLPQCQTYRVISHDSFDVVGGGWPARDELLLLQAIQKFGFGNWSAVQQYMAYLGASYFIDQIQLHYDKFYGKSLDQIQNFIHKGQINKVSNPSRKSNFHIFRGGKSIQKSTAISFLKMNQSQKQQIPCYNSKRGQFNIEYKENLQKYIADLQFKQNDSEKQIQLKFKILEAYNLGLEDRRKKHNFILQHKLLDENYQAEQNKFLQQNHYANKAHQLLIQLMRTMSRQEYLQLRKSLQFCLRIQTIIDSLRAVRVSGTHTSIKSVSKLNQMANDRIQEMGKPRKRVHRNPQDTQTQKEKAILKKLNVNKQELKAVISKAHQKNEPVFYKGIKITPINNLMTEENEM